MISKNHNMMINQITAPLAAGLDNVKNFTVMKGTVMLRLVHFISILGHRKQFTLVILQLHDINGSVTCISFQVKWCIKMWQLQD